MQKKVCYVRSYSLLIYMCNILKSGMHKNHAPISHLRYGKEDSSSPSTLIFDATTGLTRIYILYIPPDVPKKLGLRGSQNESARACFVHLV